MGIDVESTVDADARISRGSNLMIVVTAILLLAGPFVWQTRALAQSTNPTDESKPESEHTFHLNVVGPDGSPVANANLEIRATPKVTSEQIRRGTFLRGGRYGVFAKADSDGRLTLSLPREMTRFSINMKERGFGPYSARWDSGNHPQPLPEAFTAELDEGWSIGGVVVDANGFPVEDAEVDPSVYYKKRPGDTRRLGVGTSIRTDPEGKWRYDFVPSSVADLHVAINHERFQPLRLRLPRDGFEVKTGESPSGRIELQKGLTVTGKVTDESGQPIEGALVRTKFLNDIREARTDASGVYRLDGCEPRMARIVVSADGRALDMQEVRVDPELKPVNFKMQPGGHVRIRVVDEQGKGIPKARIFFQKWRGGRIDYFEFDHVQQYADKNGIWEWNEAPRDEFQADICRPDGMQLRSQPLIDRAEEYVFNPPPALVVSGRVIDASTKKPIPKFRVTPGFRNADPLLGFDWIPRSSYDASDGTYRIQFDHTGPAHVTRIEAEGYKVAISRDIRSDEGQVPIDFELQPADDIAATIVSADGKPAAKAKIAIGVAGSQIRVENGDIDDGSTYATRLDADDQGRFSIPARDEPFQLVITHESGFAYLKEGEELVTKKITLTPWARAEGTFRVGSKAIPNVVLSMYGSGIHSYGDDVPNIFTGDEVTTGKNGRYVFKKLFPGKGRIGRRILLMVDDGAVEVTSSLRVSAEFKSGETTTLDLGGSGRAVIGTLAPPADYTQRVLWNFALLNAEVDLESPTAPQALLNLRDDPVGRAEWLESEEGKAWTLTYQSYEQLRDSYPYISATVDRDGSFRIDDVPPGNYVMRLRFSKNSAGVLRDYRFIVPPIEAGNETQPLDLGVLLLND